MHSLISNPPVTGSAATLPTPQKRKPAADRRGEIVQAVLHITHGSGPEAVTATAISKAIGLTQTSVFKHFASIDDVWGAVIAHVRSEVDAVWTVAECSNPSGNTLTTVTRIIAGHLAYVRRNPALPVILGARQFAGSGDMPRRGFVAAMDEFVQRLSAILARASATGEITSDPKERVRLAWLLIGVMQATSFRLAAWDAAGAEPDVAEEARFLVETIWHGASRPQSPKPEN